MRNGSDHSVMASRAYLTHMEAVHGVAEEDLQREHLPFVADSPRTRSTQSLWLVNEIVDELVTQNIIQESDRRGALTICKEKLMEVVSHSARLLIHD